MNTPIASQPDQSEVVVHKGGGGVSFSGKDATNLYRAMTLKSSLNLWLKTKMIPTRGVTITVMLRIAGEYSGKTYKRTEAVKAIEDLGVWIETMKAGLPIKQEG